MKRGPKPRQVTQDLLEQIEHHAARGLSQKQICDALGFSETWWHAKKAEYSELGESYKKGSASVQLNIESWRIKTLQCLIFLDLTRGRFWR